MTSEIVGQGLSATRHEVPECSQVVLVSRDSHSRAAGEMRPQGALGRAWMCDVRGLDADGLVADSFDLGSFDTAHRLLENAAPSGASRSFGHSGAWSHAEPFFGCATAPCRCNVPGMSHVRSTCGRLHMA